MAKRAETKTKLRRVRMTPGERREMILDAAVNYFADHGFRAEIRQFAKDNSISPALIFKYFESKDALIDAVYVTVFETRWDISWREMIHQRNIPLPSRLEEFYNSYLARVDDRNWIRIAMRASLDGNGLTRRYLADHVTILLNHIADELDVWFRDQRLDQDQERRMERVWHLHSTVIYYLIRKHIHGVDVMQERTEFVKNTIREFFGDTIHRGGIVHPR